MFHNFSNCTKDYHVSTEDVFDPSVEMMQCAINLVAEINIPVFQENVLKWKHVQVENNVQKNMEENLLVLIKFAERYVYSSLYNIK